MQSADTDVRADCEGSRSNAVDCAEGSCGARIETCIWAHPVRVLRSGLSEILLTCLQRSPGCYYACAVRTAGLFRHEYLGRFPVVAGAFVTFTANGKWAIYGHESVSTPDRILCGWNQLAQTRAGAYFPPADAGPDQGTHAAEEGVYDLGMWYCSLRCINRLCFLAIQSSGYAHINTRSSL